MTQKKFTEELLQECNKDLSKIAKTPIPVHLKLATNTGTNLV